MTAYDAPAAATVAQPPGVDAPVGGALRGGGSRAVRPATGEQYLLRRGSAVARVGQVAAVLREFSVAGTHFVETWPESVPAPHACGVVLMPWPNRVAGAAWQWQGSIQRLDITEPALGNASHGLLRDIPYRATTLTEDSVTLAASIYPQHGWPFTLDTSVTYSLSGPAALSSARGAVAADAESGAEYGLTITHSVTNVGASQAVFGCGAHPYLRIGDVPVGDLTVTVRAGSYFVTDDRMVPVSKLPLPSELESLRTGSLIRDLHLDTGFAGLELVPHGGRSADGAPQHGGRFEHVLRAPDGRSLTLWADPDFRYTIVFTPDDFPNDIERGPAGLHRAIAIEPMTCPTNALNSGEGLITLEPGEMWSASWGLAPGTP